MQGVAVATAIDDNAAYEKSDKSIWRLHNIRCTKACLKKALCKMCVTTGMLFQTRSNLYIFI